MATLHTEFCGVEMVNPFVIAASPSSDSREKVEIALEAGWGGIVFKTVATKEKAPLLAEPNMGALTFAGKKQMAFYNYDLISERTIDDICNDIRYFKEKFPDRMLIGSIMGGDSKEWKILVEKLESVDVDMIECSMSCPQGDESGMIPAANSELLEKIIAEIKSYIKKKTPLIVKMTPNVTDIIELATAAKLGGADAICAIDTVKSFIGIDINTGLPKLNVDGLATYGGLSGPAIKPIALGCVSRIAKEVNLPIGGVGGISNYEDAIEFILLGCNMVQVCSAVSKFGFKMVKDMKTGLLSYMEQKGYECISDMKGNSLKYIVTQQELDRNYKSVCHVDKSQCIKCKACETACQDCGFNALTIGNNGYPEIDEDKCKGCGVCLTVCVKDSLSLKPKGK